MLEILPHDQLAQRLHERDIRVVYSDLDGTLFSPTGTILTDYAGNPSARSMQLRIALQKAGIELVIVTGRNRAQLTEISHLLNVKTFIGELGGFYQHGFGGQRDFHFLTGQWKELPEGTTPMQTIEELGVIDKLFDLYPGHVARVPMNITNAREVTRLVVGDFVAAAAAAAVSSQDFPIDIIDNGSRPEYKNLLPLENDVHVYHVLPKGISKGEAIRFDLEHRGINPENTLGLGDSCADLSMVGACGIFGLMGNGCNAPEVQAQIKQNDLPVIGTTGEMVDGWCEFIEALLA